MIDYERITNELNKEEHVNQPKTVQIFMWADLVVGFSPCKVPSNICSRNPYSNLDVANSVSQI